MAKNTTCATAVAAKERPVKQIRQCAQEGIKRYLVSAAASITVALILQAGSLVWWASAISQRVTFLENNLAELQTEFHKHQLATLHP